jgi:hypothetical protein
LRSGGILTDFPGVTRVVRHVVELPRIHGQIVELERRAGASNSRRCAGVRRPALARVRSAWKEGLAPISAAVLLPDGERSSIILLS